MPGVVALDGSARHKQTAGWQESGGGHALGTGASSYAAKVTSMLTSARPFSLALESQIAERQAEAVQREKADVVKQYKQTLQLCDQLRDRLRQAA